MPSFHSDRGGCRRTGDGGARLPWNNESSHTKFEADGTMTFVGNATVWDDSMVPPVAFRAAGGSALTFDAFTGGTYQYRYDVDDEIHFQVQLPHSIKVGSEIHPHVHLMNRNVIGGSGATGSFNVGLEFNWTWANIGALFPAETSAAVTCCFKGSAASGHGVFEVGDITPTSAQGGISSLFVGRLKRVNASANNYASAEIFIGGFDIHFEKDTVGSRGEYTK